MGLPTCLVIEPLNCFITLEIVGANRPPTAIFDRVLRRRIRNIHFETALSIFVISCFAIFQVVAVAV